MEVFYVCARYDESLYSIARLLAATSATTTLPRWWSFVVYVSCIIRNNDTSFVTQLCLCLFFSFHSRDTYIIFNIRGPITRSDQNAEPAVISREILISSGTTSPSDRYKIYKWALFSIYIKVC
jgi:hypothetical protein